MAFVELGRVPGVRPAYGFIPPGERAKTRLDEKLEPYGKQNVPAHTVSAMARATTPQQVQEFASLLAASTLKQ